MVITDRTMELRAPFVATPPARAERTYKRHRPRVIIVMGRDAWRYMGWGPKDKIRRSMGVHTATVRPFTFTAYVMKANHHEWDRARRWASRLARSTRK